MTLTRGGLLAVAAALALSACVADNTATPRGPAPSSAAPACVAGKSSGGGEHYERLTVVSLPGSDFLGWPAVPGTDCVEVEKAAGDTVRLVGAVDTYTWTRPVSVFDLAGAWVGPTYFTVRLFRHGQLLKQLLGRTPCPSVAFVAARGSGQNAPFSDSYGKGLGGRGMRFLEGLREDLGLSGFGLPAAAVDYPAVAVGFGSGAVQPGNLPGIYADSVAAGVARAGRIIEALVDHCPATRLVLFGYSQGAQVMGDAFASLSAHIRSHVARVVLFADARYRPGDPRVTYLPSAHTGVGIKGARRAFPAGDAAVIESWCWGRDAICQRPPHGSHFHGSVYDDYEVDAAERAADALR